MTRTITAVGLVLLIWSASGCLGGDECASAEDKYDECDIDPAPAFQGLCEAENSCVADCANAASCADLTAAFDRANTDTSNPYKQCTLRCFEPEPAM